MPEHLPVETFDLPVTEIRRGYRSAIYFDRMKRTLENPGINVPHTDVTMQVFQKNDAVLCGISEAIAILKTCTGHYSNLDKAHKRFDDYLELKLLARRDQALRHFDAAASTLTELLYIEQELEELWVNEWENLDVTALHDGDHISPWESAMHIRGNLGSFGHLESVYLGVVSRGTKVATNVRAVTEAAMGKPILFFADRFDRYSNQGADGYAAFVGGATSVASDAMGAWWGDHGVGTMPHALVAAFDGNTVEACYAYKETFPDTNLIALVDFNNDCAVEALRCADEFGDGLWGVRLDTSENMVDMSIAMNFSPDDGPEDWEPGDFKPTGVNPRLVANVRDALDRAGHDHVKIVVSGGFNPQKIKAFEYAGVPVDAYAVGSSLLAGSNDFTADVVQPIGKLGRRYRENPRLERVV